MHKQHFPAALAATLQHEGVYSADAMDPGGETFMGISRVYWPHWSGWETIDAWRKNEGSPPDLTQEVEEFYYENFWCRFQGDLVAEISPAVAMELFDTAVNMGIGRAVTFLQTALNMQNQTGVGNDLEVDGRLGKKTIEALKNILGVLNGKSRLNEEILLNCMNGEQYICYKDNPKHRYFRGWFTRV